MEPQEQSANAQACENSASTSPNPTAERVTKIVSIVLRSLEVCLAGVSIIVVILGTCFLLINLTGFWDSLSNSSLRTAVEITLSDILLLVVGVELAIMLVRRRPEDLVDIIFFVIARKMLIRTGEFYELLIGVVALAGLFAIRKYLAHHPIQKSKNN